MTYISKKPIMAYSMSDFENINSAEFKRGKDKKKRKKRGIGFYAGVGAGGLGAAGGLAAAARYGGAELKRNKELKKLREARKTSDDPSSLGDEMAGRGAKGKLDKDIQSIKNLGSKAKASGKRALDALKTPSGVGGTNKGLLREPISRLGNVFKSGKAGKAAVIGAGLAGAGAVAGGGYAAYKAMKNRKKNKK